ANAVLLRKRDDDAAPGQIIAKDDGGDRVGNALLGAFDHVRRDVLVTTERRIARQFRCLFRHRNIAWWFEGVDRCCRKARVDLDEMESPRGRPARRSPGGRQYLGLTRGAPLISAPVFAR